MIQFSVLSALPPPIWVGWGEVGGGLGEAWGFFGGGLGSFRLPGVSLGPLLFSVSPFWAPVLAQGRPNPYGGPGSQGPGPRAQDPGPNHRGGGDPYPMGGGRGAD